MPGGPTIMELYEKYILHQLPVVRFHLYLMCLGAHVVYSARSMLLSLGCIQALKCNTNTCPTGIATQNPTLNKGFHVPTKILRVKNYHNETIKVVSEILGAMGLKSHKNLNRSFLFKRAWFEY